jgi:hypothetical protein
VDSPTGSRAGAGPAGRGVMMRLSDADHVLTARPDNLQACCYQSETLRQWRQELTESTNFEAPKHLIDTEHRVSQNIIPVHCGLHFVKNVITVAQSPMTPNCQELFTPQNIFFEHSEAGPSNILLYMKEQPFGSNLIKSFH